MYFCKLKVCINAASPEREKYKSAEDKLTDGKSSLLL